VAVIIRIQVIELRRLGDTVCNSTRFRAFDGIDQDPYLAAHCKWPDTSLGQLSRYKNNKPRFCDSRKNWLFCGSTRGAETRAGIYTLVETAKANGLSPLKYITYILKDMPGSAFLQYPEYLDDYMPWNPEIIEICK